MLWKNIESYSQGSKWKDYKMAAQFLKGEYVYVRSTVWKDIYASLYDSSRTNS